MNEMKSASTTTRRALLGGAAGFAAFGARAAAATAPALPASPVAINVIDVAGQLQLVQEAIQLYARNNPKLVSRFTFTAAPAPELAGKIMAQQNAHMVDIDLVLTGNDGLSAGMDKGLWIPIVTEYAAALPKLEEIMLPGAWNAQGLANNQGIVTTFCPGGPIMEYMPDAVKVVPKTAQDFLDWTRQHPKRFLYARPANSGPGRTMLQGMPYILKDKDPKDPKNGWDKTWEYLVEVGKNVEYYPTGTGQTMKELGEGSRDIVASHCGWDLNPRILGIVPKEAGIFALEGFHWVTDAHYWAIPKGVPDAKVAVLLDLIRYILSKPAQAMTYDKGYFYPGPAVKDVPLSMAPPAEQKLINEYSRPVYARLFAETPMEVQLPADRLVYAFQRWDEQVGAHVGK